MISAIFEQFVEASPISVMSERSWNGFLHLSR